MFFTQEDYRKIEQWLQRNSVKDTEFQEALPLNGLETITLVQDEHNKKVFIKDLVDQIFKLGVSDFLNVTDKYEASYITLNEAIKLIPSGARKAGQVITFLNTDGNWQVYQFKGVLNQWNQLDLWEDLFDWGKFVVDSILPDEEDLTKSLPDANGNSYLSLKDREYNPKDFSGLGRVILRKNIVEIEDPTYGKVEKNVLYQDMINKENTIYEIRYDFNLNGKEITIPEGCVLDFQGGSLSNGNVFGTNTVIKAHRIKIFGEKLSIKSTWNIIEAYPEWFGDKNSFSINECIKTFSIVSLDGVYNCDKMITITKEVRGSNYTTLDFSNCEDEICVYQTGHRVFLANINIITNNPKPNQIGYKLFYSTKYGGADNLHIVGFNYGMQVNGTWYTSLKNIKISFVDDGSNRKSNGYGFIIGDLNEVVTSPEVNAVNFSDISVQGYKHDLYIKNASLNGVTFINLTLEGCTDTAIKCVSSDTFRPQGDITVINPYFENCHSENRIDDTQYEILDTTDTDSVFQFYGGRWANNRTPLLSFGNFFKLYGEMSTSVGFIQNVEVLNRQSIFSWETMYHKKSENKYLISNVVDSDYIYNKIPNHFVYCSGGYDGNVSLCKLALPAALNNDGIVLNATVTFRDSTNTYSKITKFYSIVIRNNSSEYYGIIKENDSIGYVYNARPLHYVDLGVKFLEYSNKLDRAELVIYANLKPNYDLSLEVNGYRAMHSKPKIYSFITFFWSTVHENVDTEDYNNYITLHLVKKKGDHNTLPEPTVEEIGDTFYSFRNSCVYRVLDINGHPAWCAEHKQVSNSEDRPTDATTGFFYFDEWRNKPIWKKGDIWVDAMGNNDTFRTSGTFSNKPTTPSVGYHYFCTDRKTTEGATNGIMIYYKGDNVWVDALGRVVS